MHLLNLTLIPSAHIITAISPSKDTIVCATNSTLNKYLVKDSKLILLKSVKTHSTIRQLSAFYHNTSSTTTNKPTPIHILVTSDSGCLSILDANNLSNIKNETFGKSGCRRIVPGQFLAADPKGRAIMVAALEKQKYVYVASRNPNTNELVISSPLESNRPSTLTYDCKGVDVGYENPVFATIEVDFGGAEEDGGDDAFDNLVKLLVYYELDLGLNHVVRKWSQPIDYTSNLLIPLPGGRDGPSGVLVCSENYLTWAHPDFPSQRIPIPQRPSVYTTPDNNNNAAAVKGILVSCYVVHKMKKTFFVLLQTEMGDVFKVTADYTQSNPDGSGGNGVTNLRIKYFDTIPVSSCLVLLKSGFLFAASEFGNHYLYQIETLGDDDTTQTEYTSSTPTNPHPKFSPRGLTNLSAVDDLDSLSPLLDARPHTTTTTTPPNPPKIYTLSGHNARSSFRVLQNGIPSTPTTESPLPGTPNGIFCLHAQESDTTHAYILVSFTNATLILAVTDAGVAETSTSPFLPTTTTIYARAIGPTGHIQIHPSGLRYTRPQSRASEWSPPPNTVIVQADANSAQVVLALSTGDLVYFEVDVDGDGRICEWGGRRWKGSSGVVCLGVAGVGGGRVRGGFVAVGCEDNTVRILSLDPDSCLEEVSVQSVPAIPESVAITLIQDTHPSSSPSSSPPTYMLHIGLSNGLLLRSTLDILTGTLSDSRLRYIGSKAVRLFKSSVRNREDSVLVVSCRPWLSHTYKSQHRVVPITTDSLEYAASFSPPTTSSTSQQQPAIVCVSGQSLRIFTLDDIGLLVNQGVVPLEYTGRRMAVDRRGADNFVVVEADHGVLCGSERIRGSGDDAVDASHSNSTDNRNLQDGDESIIKHRLPVEQFGLERAFVERGKWASCVRLIDPVGGDTLGRFELDFNEAAFCVCILEFKSEPGVTFAVVGSARDVVMSPRSCTSGFLRTYRFVEEGQALVLHHVTPIDDIPTCLCAFQGKLLVGLANALRVYDIGKKKLLRKCESRVFPHALTHIQTIQDRVIVSDIQEGIFVCQYHHPSSHPTSSGGGGGGRIVVVADDSVPRWMTCFCVLDYDTIVGGDKFGNIFVCRVPEGVVGGETDDDDPAGRGGASGRRALNGAFYKVQHLCEFYVGESITSIHRTSLVPGGREVILYTTILGTIGILVPFTAKADIDFFQSLEMEMRKASPSVLGRDHLLYRSMYVPVRCVIDGDLCEEFGGLSVEARREIAEGFEMSVSEVCKKIEDARVRVAF